MVAKVISELKSVSRLKILTKKWPLITYTTRGCSMPWLCASFSWAKVIENTDLSLDLSLNQIKLLTISDLNQNLN